MQLDHFTLVSPDIERLRRFFVDVAGLADGPRPAFGIAGHWLYQGEQAVLHLVAGERGATACGATRIDHVALRVGSPAAWDALLERLHTSGTPYQAGAIDALGRRQLFVALAPGTAVEFVI